MKKPIYPGRESKLLEFKSQVPKLDKLVKTAIAFANASGGRIIIGVDDETHEILGVTDHDREQIYDKFVNSLYDCASPTMIAQVYEQHIDGINVLVIEVPEGSQKPYFIKAKNILDGTYIRVGSSTRKANQDYILALQNERLRLSFDETPIHEEVTVLSNDLLAEYFQAKFTNRQLLNEKIIKKKDANQDKFEPTIAGCLMFCTEPDRHIPEALIRCTWFKGKDGRNIIRSENITGSLDQQANKAIELLKTWMSIKYELDGANLKKVFPLPIVALREALINALLHRKYSIAGAVKIAIFDDRVEIFSPGDFPGLVDLNTLGDGTTFLRNPSLVRIAHRMELIEVRGTGIRLMFESCIEAKLKPPQFYEEGDFVKVVFFFTPDKLTYENEIDALTDFVAFQGSVSAQQVSEFLDVSRNTAIRKLNLLVTQKKIKKIGAGATRRYSIVIPMTTKR